MDILLIISTAILSGLVTYFISHSLNKGAVFASATVTLLSGLVFPYLFPAAGTSLMVVAACSSYGGMVSKKNAPTLFDSLVISAIIGILFSITATAYAGIGGRLGTIAAISCFSWIGVKKTISSSSIKRFIPYGKFIGVRE